MPEVDLFSAFPTLAQETPANRTKTQAPLSDMDDFAQTREADNLFESEIQPSAPPAPPLSAPKEPRAFANRGRGVYHYQVNRNARGQTVDDGSPSAPSTGLKPAAEAGRVQKVAAPHRVFHLHLRGGPT